MLDSWIRRECYILGEEKDVYMTLKGGDGFEPVYVNSDYWVKDKIHKPLLRFELITETIKTFWKCPVCPLSTYGHTALTTVCVHFPEIVCIYGENWIFLKSFGSFCH